MFVHRLAKASIVPSAMSLVAATIVGLACPSLRAEDPPAVPVDSLVLFAEDADFEKWTGDRKRWRVENDTIFGESPEGDLIPEHTYLIFEGQQFGDFELTARFKIEGGNSGIQYRSKIVNPTKFKVAGYQADIDAGNRFAGILYEQDGRGIMARRGESVTVSDAGEKEINRFGDATEIGRGIHPGQWNDYRIVARGNTLEHYINGALTARVIDGQSEKAADKGLVALQLHPGPPMVVQFRNIVVREGSANSDD